jgi:LPS sulfotransferase NodH
MLDFDIGDRDVVVLSNYRSGSTAFCDVVAQRYGLKNLGEAFHRFKNQKHYEQSRGARNLVKIMTDQIDHPEFENIMSKSFVIGLSRRDVLAQISSLYISDLSGIWHRDRGAYNNYEIKIDRDRILNVTRYVLDLRERYERMRDRCNVQLEYEDILDDLKQSRIGIYHKPQNHQELLTQIQQILEQDTKIHG